MQIFECMHTQVKEDDITVVRGRKNLINVWEDTKRFQLGRNEAGLKGAIYLSVYNKCLLMRVCVQMY